MTWRVGTKLGRTLYRDEVLVGMVDTPEIAAAIVEAMNTDVALLRAQIELAEATLTAQDVCWHCKDCLVPSANVCERCPQPGECDDENCQAEGCLEA